MKKVYILLVGLFLITGCESKEENPLQKEVDQLKQQNTSLIKQNNQLSGWYEKLQQDYNYLLENGEERPQDNQPCSASSDYLILDILDDEEYQNSQYTYIIVKRNDTDPTILKIAKNMMGPSILEDRHYLFSFEGKRQDSHNFPFNFTVTGIEENINSIDFSSTCQ